MNGFCTNGPNPGKLKKKRKLIDTEIIEIVPDEGCDKIGNK